MKCPKCQAENREGVKFCEECGAKMEINCPSCSAFIPLGKNFCGKCGHSLTLPSKPTPKALSFDEKLEKIQRYLPEGLTEKILSQRAKIEGERKQVTVMFCDMEGFTHLTEQLGPEEAYSIMDEVYELLIQKVHEYEGTVNEMTGDGIVALFGAPIALEDAPQRAIRSALAIHREMARFSDKTHQEKEGIPPLKMRIGIHTGPVVVGTLGNDLRVEFKAVGDTVNLASRMEELAEPGTTYVTEDTFKLTEGFFRLDSISGARVFLVFTYRPEYVHKWGGRSYHSQVNLNRLSNRESLTMATHLLDSSEIHRELEDFILEKTEGVPFFIEEFIKSLKDLKIIERKDNQYLFAKDFLEMTIPSTIQDVIMARVDALPEGAKELLQTGSVIEREFSYELIKRVSGLSEQELLSHLSILKDAELLYERGIYPDTTYIFKHALTREVVYDSILTLRKKKLCEDIGNVIEELYKEHITEYHVVLAEHFIYSDNYVKGAKYSKLSCKKAEKTASFIDAVAYGEKRITCLEKLPVNDDVEKQIVDARTVLGLYYLQITYPVEAKAAVDPVVDVAIKRNYKRRVSQIYIIIGAYSHGVEEDYSKALEYYEKALKIGEESNDILTLAYANTNMGICLCDNVEFAKALQHFERALGINEAANVPWGKSLIKACMAIWVYTPQGKLELGFKTSNEALRIG